MCNDDIYVMRLPLVIYSFMQWMHHRLGIPPPPTRHSVSNQNYSENSWMPRTCIIFIHPSLRNENENDQFSQRGKRDEDVAQFTFCENFSICLDNKLHSSLSMTFFEDSVLMRDNWSLLLECAIKLILNKNWQFSHFLFSVSWWCQNFSEKWCKLIVNLTANQIRQCFRLS